MIFYYVLEEFSSNYSNILVPALWQFLDSHKPAIRVLM